MKIITCFLLMLMAGCATCQRHPAVCAVGGAIIVGSIAATVAANSSDRDNAIVGVKRVIK